MNVLIIEDEVPAAQKLERYLQRYDGGMTVKSKLTSVADAVSWLKTHQPELDLIFMDIQLTDGKSFEIFDQVEISKPVIFITAYDEYALDAFKVSSVDYLLKPVTFNDLSEALDKFKRFKATMAEGSNIYSALAQLQQKTFKNRFMVKVGDHIRSVVTSDIAVFFAEGRDAYLVTADGRKFIIDYKLEDIETLVDPSQFFRVSRTYLVNIDHIKDVVMYSGSRLKITPECTFAKEIIVSREKVNAFKEWFSGS